MIDKLPRCLHTCLHCSHAVILEEYTGQSKKLIFEGCWKINNVSTPVDRVNCEKFEESTVRVKRSFWEKWKGRVFIGQGYGQGGQGIVNYECFRTADNLVGEEEGTDKLQNSDDPIPRESNLADEEHELNKLPTVGKLPTIDEPPIIGKLKTELQTPGKDDHEGYDPEGHDDTECELCAEAEKYELEGEHAAEIECDPECHEQVGEDDNTQESGLATEQETKEVPPTDEIPIPRLPTIYELPFIERHNPPVKEQVTRECEAPELIDVKGESEHDSGEHTETDITVPDIDVWKEKAKGKKNTTRSLILRALTHNITRLSDIAEFADVDPSTAHYHLRNLVRCGRVIKISRGNYEFSDHSSKNDHSSKSESQFFDTFLKNEDQSLRGVTGEIQLHPYEKNILMEILTKDNKYEQYSGRKLALKCGMSRNTIHKYTLELEKKRLIKIEKVGKQYIYTPTKVSIYGLTDFFTSLKTGSKIDSSSSKSEPVREPMNSGLQVDCVGIVTDEVVPAGTVDTATDGIHVDPADEVTDEVHADPVDGIKDPGNTSPTNIFETFEESLNFQQKNAHRLIIQFKLLRCSHSRLKGTGWIFGQKSIHQHFTEAYVFKSKDPSREIINVLPKDPFIFTSEFDFNTKVIDFVNEVIVRLRNYGIVIDLSEPAEIRMQHEAVEDDVFARKLIKRGLLHFRCKVKTVDSTGELMEYVIGIDKSKKLHFEIEGREAHVLTANFEAFVDDVISGKIDRKVLREMPQRLDDIEDWIQREFGVIEETLERNIEGIQDTQTLLHQNQLEFSQNLISHIEMVQKIGEAAISVKQAADTVKDMTEALYDVMRSVTRPLWDHTTNTREIEIA